jgi:hypothetical protein
MLPAKFNFFLDEIIWLHNIEVLHKLEGAGHNLTAILQIE